MNKVEKTLKKIVDLVFYGIGAYDGPEHDQFYAVMDILEEAGYGPAVEKTDCDTTFYVYADGSLWGSNPSQVGCGGWILKDSEDNEYDRGLEYLESKTKNVTNNQAEYAGPLAFFRYLVDTGWGLNPNDGNIVLRMDSQLVINQLSGKWKCNNRKLRVMRDECLRLINAIPVKISFEWIPREENSEADAWSREGL